MPYKVPNKYAASLYMDRKSVRLAELEAINAELLEACEAALHNPLDLPTAVVEMLEAAIAKAEGE